MQEILQFLLSIVIILVAAKVFGLLASRFGQSAILGELIAGVLIGPAVLGFVTETNILKTIGEIGAIVLLFEAGLSTNIKEFAKASGWAVLVAVVGVIAPYVLGYFTFLHFGFTNIQAIFAGAVLTATSVGITARVFVDFKKIEAEEAKIVLGAAVIDDIIGLIILAVVSRVVAGTGISFSFVAQTAGIAFGLLAVFIGVGFLIVPFLFKLIAKTEKNFLALILALIICGLYAFFAVEAKLAAIVGAFAAGLVLSNVPQKEAIKIQIKPLYMLLVPIFFVLMGTKVDVKVFNPFASESSGIILLTAVLFVVAVAGKIISGFAVFKKKINKLLIGVSMVPRGEVGLIFASIGLECGVFGNSGYSSLVAVIMLTTFITPIFLKHIIKKS